MNELGAYSEIDMKGLPPEWYENDVPVEAQKRLIAAIPECRLLWNQPLHAYQVFYRTPGCVERLRGGRFATGWKILAFDFEKPLSIDAVIECLRKWETINREIREKGFKDLDAWIDARAEQLLREDKVKEDDLFDAFFGTENSAHKYASGQVWSGWKSKPDLKEKAAAK